MKKGGIIRYPIFVENSYRRFLLSLLADTHKEILAITVNDDDFKKSYKSMTRQDKDNDVLDDFDKKTEKIKSSFLLKIPQIVVRLLKRGREVGKFNFKNIISASPPLAPDIAESILMHGSSAKKTEDLMMLWARENSRLIKSINSKFLDDVAISVFQSVQEGLNPTLLAKELEEKYSLSKKRAKLIALDQILKLNGALTRQRYLDLGLKYYTWSTSNDNRVRKSHSVLQGKICSLTDPTVFKDSPDEKQWSKRSSIGGDEHHPGYAIACRCRIAWLEI